MDYHYACAAASQDGISVVCYEVTKSSENNVTVGFIHQSEAVIDENSEEGRQVQNRTIVSCEESIPMAKFRFGKPCVSPSGKVTLLDGGHCLGPHREKPRGNLYVWRQGFKAEESSLVKLQLPEDHERMEHVNLHVFDDDTAFVSIIANCVRKPSGENVKHLRCDLKNGTVELMELQDQNIPPFIMKSRKDDQMLLFNNSKRLFLMNGVMETPVVMELGDAGTNGIEYSEDNYPVGIKSKYKVIQNGHNGEHVQNGMGNTTFGNMLIKTREPNDNVKIHLIKDPQAGIEKPPLLEYTDVSHDGVKFSISDDGQYAAVAVNDMKENCFIDIYHLQNLTKIRVTPPELYSEFDKQTVCEIGALVFTPESEHKPQQLAIAFRTNSAFFATFHEISHNGQNPCIKNTKYCVLKDGLSDWDKTKRPRYYDIQASQDFMIIAGSNIGAFLVPYSYPLK